VSKKQSRKTVSKKQWAEPIVAYKSSPLGSPMRSRFVSPARLVLGVGSLNVVECSCLVLENSLYDILSSNIVVAFLAIFSGKTLYVFNTIAVVAVQGSNIRILYPNIQANTNRRCLFLKFL
jgi:hypothetical protein